MQTRVKNMSLQPASILVLAMMMATSLFGANANPTLTITAPTGNEKWSNALFTVTGTAKDNVAISNVFLSLNDGGWTAATLSGGGGNWRADVALTPGTNTIAAYAVGAGGNLSTTNTVKFVYILTAPLTVLTNGDGTVTPNDNKKLLDIGVGYSLKAAAAKGFGFVNWTDGDGNVLTGKATLTFIMASNLTFVANFKDITPPTITITAPKANQKWSNALFSVTGTAKDNVTVSNVWYSLNDGGWTAATLSGGGSHWTAGVTLNPGPNTIAAYAVGTGDNLSTTNTVKFDYILSAPLTVRTNGDGTVTPNDNNKLLQIGASYSLKATPAKGFAFSHWSGGVPMTGVPTITFTMSSNLTIIANFRDITPPTISITTPKSGETYSNSIIQAGGTASDNVAVTSVEAQINGGGWMPARGTTSWSAQLPVVTGNNTVEAFAMDAAGNVSKTNHVTFLGIPGTSQPNWAPASLSNSVVELLPSTGGSHSLSFDGKLFNWGDTNDSGVAGIGDYQYQEISTNYGLTQLSFGGPPNVNGNTVDVAFTFTNFDTGVYTNESSLEVGSFSIATSVAKLLPATWSGQKFSFNETTTKFTAALTSVSDVTVDINGKAISGTYEVSDASPIGAFLVIQYETDTIYVQMTYTSKGHGFFNVNTYLNGAFKVFHDGTFVSP